MRSCQDYLAELRGKIHQVEDNLRYETKNFYRLHEMLNEEKDKWIAEFKQQELKIQTNESKLKEKGVILDKLKVEFNEVRKRVSALKLDNEKLYRDLQKAKTHLQSKMNKFLLEQANLEKELSTVNDLLRDTKISNKWSRVFKERDLKAREEEKEGQLKEKLKVLRVEFQKKVADYEENLKEIDTVNIAPKREKLRALEEVLGQMTAECKELQKKNENLEREIELLKQI